MPISYSIKIFFQSIINQNHREFGEFIKALRLAQGIIFVLTTINLTGCSHEECDPLTSKFCNYQAGDVLNKIKSFNLDITDLASVGAKNSIDSPESLIQTVGIPVKPSFSKDEINLGAKTTIRYLNSLMNQKSLYKIEYIKGKGKTFSVAISTRGKKLNQWNCKVGTEGRVTMVKCRS